jgi:thiol-disulfide isomerase/thioredoxin
MDIVASRSFPRVGRLRRWLVIVSLFVALCTLAAQVTADDAKPMGSTTLVALKESVQSLFSLPSLDGPTHELARLRGRVVLVHFFATWCEPCRVEMASLRQLQSAVASVILASLPYFAVAAAFAYFLYPAIH